MHIDARSHYFKGVDVKEIKTIQLLDMKQPLIQPIVIDSTNWTTSCIEYNSPIHTDSCYVTGHNIELKIETASKVSGNLMRNSGRQLYGHIICCMFPEMMDTHGIVQHTITEKNRFGASFQHFTQYSKDIELHTQRQTTKEIHMAMKPYTKLMPLPELSFKGPFVEMKTIPRHNKIIFDLRIRYIDLSMVDIPSIKAYFKGKIDIIVDTYTIIDGLRGVRIIGYR